VNDDEDEDEAEPLVLRRTDGLPIVPLNLDVVGSTQIVPALLRPDLNVSRIAPIWASGLELSHGAAVLAQLATRYDDAAALWGPCQMITPVIDPALDEALAEEGVGGVMLGNDLLQHVWLTLVGPAGLIVVMTAEADN
jgi:hypothetical protein